MNSFNTGPDLLRMIRLAPAHLRSDAADFVRHGYVQGLGREPEYDPAGPSAPALTGDPYLERPRFAYAVAFSVESLGRGYEAALDAFAAVLGYTRNRPMLVEALRSLYPSQEELVGAGEELITRVQDNSRRLDRIVAMCSVA
jgi:hypothetical protein